ncbi:tryptophan synthase subunit alpha [Nonomuraea zeae]|uniref:Tryptophan synthase alpha chain n=1 Tax=Nonomuraea zeae TaxID=1642303 RepID=A0A5S4FK75_9ACTN|nr:tryptophan synthase subunit alpha [Nonomuraea zeae]TMR21062.1 tryptophan synthase subunit alpha [Nonomuraea zeae]
MSVRTVVEQARREGRAALLGYLPVGFPDVDTSVAAMKAMVAGGVDVVEVGLPYSDPLMDGPLIQRATEAALAFGVTPADAFTAVRALAADRVPALVMTYWTVVDRYGVDSFAADLAAAGGAGLITPDLIPDEAAGWHAAADRHGLDRVHLVAPTSTPERLARAARSSRGFLYAASVMGVTGERELVSGGAKGLVARVREVTDLPVCVGLGVGNGAQAAEVAEFADGVIVGSAFVRALMDAPNAASGVAAVEAVARELAAGVRRQPAILGRP